MDDDLWALVIGAPEALAGDGTAVTVICPKCHVRIVGGGPSSSS